MELPERSLLVDVQIWIEYCLKRLLCKERIIEEIQSQKKVSEETILAVWNELENQNPEFFIAYNLRSRIREQLVLQQFLSKNST